MNPIYVLSGGGSGATLVVTGVAGDTCTITSGTKTYTKTFGTDKKATFKGLATGTWTVKMTNTTGQTATRTITITADYAITIAYFSATISITYPANSTCVVKDSSDVTVATDTNTTTSAKTWTVTVGATGTYTITATATDGSGKSKSTTVSITTEGQVVNITLSYLLMLYDAGNQYSDITGGWIAMPRTGYVTNDPIFNADNVVVEPTNSNGECGMVTTNKIDLTDIKTLHFYLKSEGGGSWAGNPEYYPDDTQNAQAAGASTVQSARIDNYRMAADVKISEMADYKDYPVDVSALTGEHYILIATVNLANYWYAKLTVTKVWGEPQ